MDVAGYCPQTAQAVYNKLLVSYPDKKSVLDVNLRKFNGQLTETEKNIAQQLAPVKTHGYFVFHDAYGYFEKRFDLSPSGILRSTLKFSGCADTQ